MLFGRLPEYSGRRLLSMCRAHGFHPLASCGEMLNTFPIRTLALDIGTRRTGVAYCDDSNGIPLPLETIKHASEEEFTAQVFSLAQSRKVDAIVVGLPLLPSGQEGAQSKSVRAYAATLEKLGIPLSFLDERYTTPQQTAPDGDALAACSILTTFLERKDI